MNNFNYIYCIPYYTMLPFKSTALVVLILILLSAEIFVIRKWSTNEK